MSVTVHGKWRQPVVTGLTVYPEGQEPEGFSATTYTHAPPEDEGEEEPTRIRISRFPLDCTKSRLPEFSCIFRHVIPGGTYKCRHPEREMQKCQEGIPQDCPLRKGPTTISIFSEEEAMSLFGLLPENMRQMLSDGFVPSVERITDFFTAIEDSPYEILDSQKPALAKLKALM